MWLRFLASKTGILVVVGVALVGVALASDGTLRLVGIPGLVLVVIGQLRRTDAHMHAFDTGTGALARQIGSAEQRIGAAEERVGAGEARLGATELGLGAAERRLGATEERVGASDARLGAAEDGLRHQQRYIERAIERVRGESEKIIDRIREVETRTTANTRRVEGIDEAIERIGRESEVILDRIRGVEIRTTANAREVEEAIERIRRESQAIIERIRGVEVRQTSAAQRVEQLVGEERRQWTLAVARHRAEHVSRDRILLLLTIHRSGSTLVYDMLRTHPDVDVDPLATTWDMLGLAGRRYPAAMSNRPGGAVEMEVQDGTGVLIPALPQLAVQGRASKWLIEKAHPQFVDFDANRLADRIAALRVEDTEVRIAYVVRKPLDVLWSFYEYKVRDPAWYAWLSIEELPDFVLRSYRSLAKLHGFEPATVLDYARHRDPAGPLVDFAAGLSCDPDEFDGEAWHAFACAATDRETRREQIGGPFLGDADPERHIDGPDGVWRHYRAVIDETTKIWSELVGRDSLY